MFLNPYMRRIKCELNDFSDFIDIQTVFELLIDYMSELLKISVVSPSSISLEADSKFEMSILRSVIVDLKAKLCFFQKKLNPLQWPREQRRSESLESTEPDMVPV